MSRSAQKLLASERPLVIGHRGYSQLAPENTLPSYERALAAGVDLVELDCQQTKDGVLVAIHDAVLDRTTDACARWKQRRIKVGSRTALEIRSLDAGRWFGAEFAGTRVPLLAEALDCIQKGSVTLIERKTGDAPDLVGLLRQKRLINKVIIQSFDWAFLHAVHRLAPEQILGALGPPRLLSSGRKRLFRRRLSSAWLRELRKTGARLVVWNHQVSKRAIRLAHRQGLKVWVYTVNTRRRATRLLNIGVDGMITDNPALLWKILAVRAAPEGRTKSGGARTPTSASGSRSFEI